MNLPDIPWDAFLVVLGAAALGAVIGLDRELRDKPAGLRTHILVSMAAALFVLLAQELVGMDAAPGRVRSDPIRIIEAIVTGVAFLGAGTIFRSRDNETVEGLTTAASLLVSGAIGVAVAMHEWLLAAGSALLTLVVLRVLGALESALQRRREKASGAAGAAPR